MRIKQIKEMLTICTLAVGDLIRKRIEVDYWTSKEIFEASGVSQSRLTELQNLEKYKRQISEKIIGQLISGGVFTVDELISSVEKRKKISRDEFRFFRSLRIHEAPEINEISLQVFEAGGDPVRVMKDWLKKNAK